MRLIIQKAGTYNDERLRAHKLQPGDVLNTRLEYGQSLIADGFAVAEAQIESAPSDSAEPSDNARKGNDEEPGESKEIDLSDGVDDGEAGFAGKTLATRKRAKAK